MFRHLSFGLAVIAAGPASALSCAVPTVQAAYAAAAESPADYVIAIGSLTATGPSDPPEGAVAQGGDINMMVGFTQPAQFSGELFTGTGFGNAQSFAVTADVSCVVAWCGSFPDSDNAMYFFQRNADGSHGIELGACPFWVFPNPTQAQRQQVVSCYQNGGC